MSEVEKRLDQLSKKFIHWVTDADTLWLMQQLRASLEREGKLREALEFYANWDWTDKYVQPVPKRARQTLEDVKNGK